MLVGMILVVLGFCGSTSMWSYISNDRRYTYSPPFTDHELMMLGMFILCLISLMVGIVMIVFSIIKKNNTDTLQRLESMQEGGNILGICPSCGLNLAGNVIKCPKCGCEIKMKGEE